jgi:hypothetical protein
VDDHIQLDDYIQMDSYPKKFTISENAKIEIHKVRYEKLTNTLKDVQISEIELDPALFPTKAFTHTIVNEKYLVIATENYFVCHDFTGFDDPRVLRSALLFNDETLAKLDKNIHLQPLPNENKCIYSIDQDTCLIEISQNLTVRKEFKTVGTPQVFGHLIAYQPDKETLVVFNVETNEEEFKLSIGKYFKYILISPNMKYLLTVHELLFEHEIRLHKMENRQLLVRLPVEHTENIIMNNKFIVHLAYRNDTILKKYQIEDLEN